MPNVQGPKSHHLYWWFLSRSFFILYARPKGWGALVAGNTSRRVVNQKRVGCSPGWWSPSWGCKAAPPGDGQSSHSLSKLLGRGTSAGKILSSQQGTQILGCWIEIKRKLIASRSEKTAVAWRRVSAGWERSTAVLFSAEKSVELWQEVEVHRTWSRTPFPSCSATGGGDSLCKITVALLQTSPFPGCSGHGTHLLVQPRWVHWAGAWCHPLPACKEGIPRWLVIFWKSSCKVFSGEARGITPMQNTYTYSNRYYF